MAGAAGALGDRLAGSRRPSGQKDNIERGRQKTVGTSEALAVDFAGPPEQQATGRPRITSGKGIGVAAAPEIARQAENILIQHRYAVHIGHRYGKTNPLQQISEARPIFLRRWSGLRT